MSIVLANQKKATLLQQQKAYLAGLTIRLFVNNVTPAGATTEAGLTECSDSGYAAVNNVGYGNAVINAGNQGESDGPTITWTFTHFPGDFTVYGYYLTDPVDGKLVFSERAANPFPCTAAGQIYVVTPKVLFDTM